MTTFVASVSDVLPDTPKLENMLFTKQIKLNTKGSCYILQIFKVGNCPIEGKRRVASLDYSVSQITYLVIIQ